MNDKSKFSDLIETRRKELPGDHLVTASRLWLQMGDVKNEFKKVHSFLSRDDWIEKVKQHENRQTEKELV